MLSTYRGCGCRVLGAVSLRTAPLLSRLAMPAIEGAWDCDRERLGRSLARYLQYCKASRREADMPTRPQRKLNGLGL
jgi:hypothetical protein